MDIRFKGNHSFLHRRRFSRRAILRSSSVGAAGILGAALIGCSSDDDDGSNGSSGSSPQPTTASGSSGGSSSTPKTGGIVRANLGSTEPPHFDIHQGVQTVFTYSAGLGYSQLIQYDPFNEEEIIADLANTWEHPDNTTLTFKLNQATFHDGTQLTSEDVVVSLERMISPPEGVAAPRQGQLAMIDRVEAPDMQTVVLRLKRPSAALLSILATNFMGIYAAADILDDQFDHGATINGTGPFKLERYDRGSRIIFSKNENYFLPGQPYVDGFEWHIIPDDVRAFEAFRNQDLDMMSIPVGNVADVENMDGATLLATSGLTGYQNSVAVDTAPWTDVRAVQAIGLATDKDAGNAVMFDGRGYPGGLYPPGAPFSLSEEELLMIPGYKGIGDGQESDMDARRAEARKLLSAASVPEGYPTRMTGRDAGEDWAVFVSDQLRQVGLDIDLVVLDTPTWNEVRPAREYGDMFTSTRGIQFPDPDSAFGDAIITSGGRNWTGFSDPDLDRMFEEQSAELDPERRRTIADEMQKRYLTNYPPDLTLFIESRWGNHNYVQGYGALYMSYFVSRKFQWLWLDK